MVGIYLILKLSAENMFNLALKTYIHLFYSG